MPVARSALLDAGAAITGRLLDASSLSIQLLSAGGTIPYPTDGLSRGLRRFALRAHFHGELDAPLQTQST